MVATLLVLSVLLIQRPPAVAQPPTQLVLPLRAIHAGGNWGTNPLVAAHWEADRSNPLVPASYLAWLRQLHVNWIGLSVGLTYDDSMDSTIERNTKYTSEGVSFGDDALRQMIREFREHGIDVYLTISFEAHAARDAECPVWRAQLGAPGIDVGIPPECWPWRPDHPEHERFVAEFWETYTQQAVHVAALAEEEGVRLYSLGTETDMLFRTRSGGRFVNDFGRELRAMVARVRAVYTGLLTYDMHYSVLLHRDIFGPGSDHLWNDLDLDAVGVSAWFPLTETPPSTVMSVDEAQAEYEQIIADYLIPLAKRNPDRPILFLESGAMDLVAAPAQPSDPAGFPPFILQDANNNGIDDGRETQANLIGGLLKVMQLHPGILNGAFWWDNWFASDELWAQWWAGRRNHAVRNKPSEDVVRASYDDFRSLLWLPVRMLYVGEGAHVVLVELANASVYTASSSSPDVATVAVSGSRVVVSPVAEGVATVTVTGEGTADTLQFTVAVRDFEAERGALEALYHATDGDNWTDSANWLTEAPFEDWYGVEVNPPGHVTGLRLGGWDESLGRSVGNGLVGILPPELGDLAHLRHLSLAGNELTGPIPAELGQLTELRGLYLAVSNLMGPIPMDLGRLTNLLDLDLGGNALTGAIPASLTQLSDLRWFNLGGTGVCIPDDPAIHAWLATIPEFRSSGLVCAGSPPVVVASLSNRTLAQGSTLDVDLAQAFVDPAGEALTYTVSSSAPHLVTALVAGARLRLTALGVGTATILVTAADPGGLSATQVFTATVRRAATGSFTDHPIVAGVTSLKAVHFAELRSRIDGVREAAGLRRFGWTDLVLRPGVTPVRLVHLLELRSAVAAAYVASGRSAPSWTDASPTAGETPIRAAHLMELRAAVVALE